MSRKAILDGESRLMTPSGVKAIRDQLGSTKAMAEKLEVTPRAVRYLLRNGVKRRKLEREVRGVG
jgi:hypothetical protein